MGKRKAAVFPDPVCAAPRTLRPARIGGTHCCWTGVGVWIPSEAHAVMSHGATPIAAKVVGAGVAAAADKEDVEEDSADELLSLSPWSDPEGEEAAGDCHDGTLISADAAVAADESLLVCLGPPLVASGEVRSAFRRRRFFAELPNNFMVALENSQNKPSFLTSRLSF